MTTYAQFRPTGFDCKGLGLPDRQDWIVLGVSQTRDSGTRAQSNFAAAKRILDDAGVEYEDHRFGHWGPGWFELILVAPTEAGERQVDEIEGALANYPILDDSDYSEREYTEAARYWATLDMRERVRLSKKYRFHLMACRRDEVPRDESGELCSYLGEGC